MTRVILFLALIPLSSFRAPAWAQSYEGPFVESHAHIVIYQSFTEGAVQYRVDASEGASELTAASYVSSLDRNNIKCALGFHGIAFDDKQQELLSHAERLLDLYPERFILFAEIFRNNPLDWYDATELDPLLGTGLFSGFGEIQFLNPPLGTGAGPGVTLIVKPNDGRFLSIYKALGDRGLFVMAHPGSREGVDEAVSHDPRVTWIIHGSQVHGDWTELGELGELLDRHPNLYYTLDFGEALPEMLPLTKSLDPEGAEKFLAKMNDPVFFNGLLKKMVSTWKDTIEARPDRFLWGTDMALPTWQWQEPGVIDMMVKFSRAFIGKLAPIAGENYAYKNAERVLGGCPVPIDIKPGSSPNSINLGSGGTVPVAILSTGSFDATTVDPATVTLAGAPVKLKRKGSPMASFEDVNGDGLLDLVVHVSTEALQLSDRAMMAVLEGKTFAGAAIRGRDTVRVVP